MADITIEEENLIINIKDIRKIFSLEKKYLRKHKNIIILEYENKTGYHEGIIDLLNELKKKKIP